MRSTRCAAHDNGVTGVVLAQVGTPEAPTSRAVGRYLKQFLSDRRIVDYPAWLWQQGQTIVAKSILYLPADLPPGDYALRVSMFDLAVGPGELLPATGDATLLTLPIR